MCQSTTFVELKHLDKKNANSKLMSPSTMQGELNISLPWSNYVVYIFRHAEEIDIELDKPYMDGMIIWV